MGDSITAHGTSHGWGSNFLGMPRGPTPGDWQGLQPNGHRLPKLWILVDRYAAMPPVIENSDRGGPPQMTRLLSRFGASRLCYWIGELARHRCGYGLVQQWEVEVSLHVHAQGQRDRESNGKGWRPRSSLNIRASRLRGGTRRRMLVIDKGSRARLNEHPG
jgi:hypothetical protein